MSFYATSYPPGSTCVKTRARAQPASPSAPALRAPALRAPALRAPALRASVLRAPVLSPAPQVQPRQAARSVWALVVAEKLTPALLGKTVPASIPRAYSVGPAQARPVLGASVWHLLQEQAVASLVVLAHFEHMLRLGPPDQAW